MFNSREEVRGLEHIQSIAANSGFGEHMVVPYAGIPYITFEMNKVSRLISILMSALDKC